MIKVTATEVKALLPTCLKIITDREFVTIDEQSMATAAFKYCRHRHMYNLIRQSLQGTPTVTGLTNIISSNFYNIQPFDFKPEVNDCDEAARDFVSWFSGQGLAVGEAILEGHDAVIFITPNLKYKYIEPQTCGIVGTTKKLKVVRM